MNVGRDNVYHEEERVFIHAAEAMDWPIREFCRVPIYFRGRKYYLSAKREGERPHPMVYELWPWPAELHESSRDAIIYDEAYVVERDKAAMSGRRHDRFYFFLLPLYPFLGLFWSGFKSRFLVPVGFESGSITKASIVLTFNLCIAEAIAVGWLGGGILTFFLNWPALRTVDWLLLLLLVCDSVLRFGQSLGFDVEHHWGFCEWVWARDH